MKNVMPLPLLGRPSEFETLRNFLQAIKYREEEIIARLHLASPEQLDLATLNNIRTDRMQALDSLNLVIRLFLLGQFADVKEVEEHFPPAEWNVICALGLISDKTEDKYAATVALYPVGGQYFASDRWNNPDGAPKQSFPDVVYPALTRSTREFLKFLPLDGCDSFLEACAGSGIAAIAAAPHVRRSWSADITERCTRFAEFNVALNGLTNVSVVQGDLYEPVQGKVFDRIAAHPPYMPVLRPAEIYYDGGEDGEQLTRKIVEGLPSILHPGGRLYCRTLGTDREEKSFEERVRGWLGDSESDFDLAFFVTKNVELLRFAIDTAIRKSTGQEEVGQWLTHFNRLGIKEMLTGVLVLQRRESERPVFTVRRSVAPETSREDTENLLRWQTENAEPARHHSRSSYPVVAPKLQITACHSLENGIPIASEWRLSSSLPFLMDCKIDPWMADLLCLFDGTRTIPQTHADAIQNEWIRPDTPMNEFENLIRTLISGGFLSERRTPTTAEAK
jgi:hypothetical protein